MLGHGGRDIPEKTIEDIVEEAKGIISSGIDTESKYADLKEELL
jgi:pyruvate ferredoxin oxidoreductase alpha subunit